MTHRLSSAAAEQRITPWQDDNAVSACPFCSTNFHPLTNRKHHCRLCGRVVCSLPPRAPARPTSCSGLFAVDAQSGRLEEVVEGVDYGVRRRTSSTMGVGGGGMGGAGGEEEKGSKGVRVCKECRPVLLWVECSKMGMAIEADECLTLQTTTVCR
jgi:rabenosyn-5